MLRPRTLNKEGIKTEHQFLTQATALVTYDHIGLHAPPPPLSLSVSLA